MKVCTSVHHLVIQDLVQNLVYLVQLHHCTMTPMHLTLEVTMLVAVWVLVLRQLVKLEVLSPSHLEDIEHLLCEH